jgi:hypothetical protein
LFLVGIHAETLPEKIERRTFDYNIDTESPGVE